MIAIVTLSTGSSWWVDMLWISVLCLCVCCILQQIQIRKIVRTLMSVSDVADSLSLEG